MQYLQVEIVGRVASKKNSKRAFFNKRMGRIMVLSSASYEKFKNDALKQLGFYQVGVQAPYRVDYRFEMRGKGATDGDNMEASINDVLQEAGILDDDKNILKWGGEKVLNSKEYRTIITIQSLNLDNGVDTK